MATSTKEASDATAAKEEMRAAMEDRQTEQTKTAEELTKLSETVQQEQTALLAQIDQLKHENDRSAAQLESLQSTKAAEITDLRSELHTAQMALQDEHVRVAESQKEHLHLVQSVRDETRAELTERIDELQKECDTKTAELDALESTKTAEITELRSALTAATVELQDVHVRAEQSQKEHVVLVQSVRDETRHELTKRIDELQSERDDLSVRLNDVSEQLTNVVEQKQVETEQHSKEVYFIYFFIYLK